ncbi:hypothetical protein IW261DRAFT_1421194 [Armillaria novae-zelandiae]|uniref:Uncharacterized protein n=1 Tax=Armillaria novae-zelandiae TaxID=153914 RepID=A0AA39P479_9AGAR|nr:hypothetical protein IW261DRAFT_1421194 [Armillaria novae-zelandiae]
MSLSGSLFLQCFSLLFVSQSPLVQYTLFFIALISALVRWGLPSRALCLLIAELDAAQAGFHSSVEKGLMKKAKKAHRKRYQALEEAVAKHARALSSCDDLYEDTKALFRGRSFAVYWCLYKVKCFRTRTMHLDFLCRNGEEDWSLPHARRERDMR